MEKPWNCCRPAWLCRSILAGEMVGETAISSCRDAEDAQKNHRGGGAAFVGSLSGHAQQPRLYRVGIMLAGLPVRGIDLRAGERPCAIAVCPPGRRLPGVRWQLQGDTEQAHRGIEAAEAEASLMA